MTVFVVRHLTKYRYKRPVRLGEHRLMFRPRDSFDQRLLHSHLDISPKPCRVRWIHDVFGNCVTLFDFDTSSAYIEVESTIRLEHTPENAPDFQIEEYAKLHPFKYAAEQLPDLSSCMRRQSPDPEKRASHRSRLATVPPCPQAPKAAISNRSLLKRNRSLDNPALKFRILKTQPAETHRGIRGFRRETAEIPRQRPGSWPLTSGNVGTSVTARNP
jgi:transglutaminase-like putative cysteine protease